MAWSHGDPRAGPALARRESFAFEPRRRGASRVEVRQRDVVCRVRQREEFFGVGAAAPFRVLSAKSRNSLEPLNVTAKSRGELAAGPRRYLVGVYSVSG